MSEQAGWLRRQRWELRYRRHTWPDKLARWVAWRLPRHLVMWCYVRVVAHATTGKHGSTVAPQLTAMDALGRWEREQMQEKR
jgi:hypothetical protein